MSSSSQIRHSYPYAEGYLSLAPDLKPNDPHQQWLVDQLKEIDERQEAPYGNPPLIGLPENIHINSPAPPCTNHMNHRCRCHCMSVATYGLDNAKLILDPPPPMSASATQPTFDRNQLVCKLEITSVYIR